MHLREARPNDFHDMGVIQSDCNLRDTLTRYFARHQEKYKTSYYRSSVRFTKNRASQVGAVPIVVETDPSDYADDQRQKSPEVVGFAIMVRIGESAKSQEWKARNQGWFASLNRGLVSVEDFYGKVFPTTEPTFRSDLFNNILPLLCLPFDHEVFTEAWEVDLLFVSPDWQRKGLGRKLLQWAFDRATEEKVPVLVKSSALGGPAYRACGFRSLGSIGLDKWFDTLEFGGEEPQMWCWEPKECEGQWFERGKTALEKLKSEGKA